MKITARAHSNIALVKYWGKRHSQLNLPAVGSISMTLEALHTETTVEFSENYKEDQLILNGKEGSSADAHRISHFLDLVRHHSGKNLAARIESVNNFPTAAGLASSASGFAALAKAASAAIDLKLSDKELSILARQGSGSAARSIFGGFVEMHKGKKSDGRDAYAEQLFSEEYWDLRLLIAVTSESPKKTGSTDGMTLSKNTSPYFKPWVESHPDDLKEMRQILKNKDLQKLGELSEFSCLKMHALAMASNPGMVYWNGATITGMHLIRELREQGTEAYFTIDAGPQLKVICLPGNVDKLTSELSAISGVTRVLCTKIGPGAYVTGENA